MEWIIYVTIYFSIMGFLAYRMVRGILKVFHPDRRPGVTLSKDLYIPENLLDKKILFIGSSGSGKTTAARILINRLAERGDGMAIFAIHSKFLYQEVLPYLDRDVEDIVIIDPMDTAYPPPLNPLVMPERGFEAKIDSIVDALDPFFSVRELGRSLLTNSMYALAGIKGVNLTHVIDMLHPDNDEMREKVCSQIENPMVSDFFINQFKTINKQALGTTIRNLQDFLRPNHIHAMFTSKKCINFRKLMDQRKIVLINVSDADLGPRNAQVFAQYIVNEIQRCAISRSTKDDDHSLFHLVLDEFPEYLPGDSLYKYLVRLRNVKVSIIPICQNLVQVEPNMQQLMLQNIGTKIVFNVEARDANIFSNHFTFTQKGEILRVEPWGFTNLEMGEAWAKIGKQVISTRFSPNFKPNNIPIQAFQNSSRKSFQ
jgi:ABC-type oligopeptide transport system ATPase subunit